MSKQKSIWSYIRGYKFNSLLLKNFAYVFLLVTVPILLILMLNYTRFNDVVNKRVMDMNGQLLQQSAVVTDNMVVSLLDDLNVITQQGVVMEIVQLDEVGVTYNERLLRVVDLTKKQFENNNLIKTTYIYSDVNEMLISDGRARSIRQIAEKEKWYYIHKQNPMVVPYILVNNQNSVFVCQPIWSPKGKVSGLFVLDVDFQKLQDVLKDQEATKRGTFLVMDMSNEILYCSDEYAAKRDPDAMSAYKQDVAGVKLGLSQLVEGNYGTRIVSVRASVHNSWKYAFVTELPQYQEEVNVLRLFLISSITVGVFTSLVVAWLITVLTYRPIRKIVDVIQNPQLHWSEREASKQSNEMLYITSNILAAQNGEEDISQNLGDRIRSLRQAQFRALQFQIDPHFLYNTLETIKWNAVEEIGLGNKTSKMLTKVARLYRLGLENDDVIVSVKDELDFLKLYIEIVRIRFGDSITFHWDVDEELYNCSIIKMCLQPIVENAIQHGLRPKNYKGNIMVSVYKQKENLCVCVENDGQNISRSEMNMLNDKLKTGAGFEENKVGLRNVNERIKLIYGRKYGVKVELVEGNESSVPDPTEKVRVILTFPCRNFNRSEEIK